MEFREVSHWEERSGDCAVQICRGTAVKGNDVRYRSGARSEVIGIGGNLSEQLLNPGLAVPINTGSGDRSAGSLLRTSFYVLASAVCYYVATQIAWVLCFPDSKVSLIFPPHAVLLCILLLVPTRHWWAY